jgi:uncharacterized protein YgbK (DUF1537 family)
MEALALHGVPTVLFIRIPSAAELASFADCQAIGIAGSSRSRSPDWMDRELTPVLTWLEGLGARHCHYKVCSTFDSSPTVGSIGRAIDIGRAVFAQTTVPLLVGAPQLKRYTAFGHLFAAYQGAVHRIDRHPVMSRHPVTPMHESDLRLHLAAQTATPIGLASLDLLGRADASAEVDRIIAATGGVVLLDVVDAATQHAAGRQLVRLAPLVGPFVVGSSGVEYALLRALTGSGEIGGVANFAPLEGVDRTVVLSGSCSPTTERQIRFALAHGFIGVATDPMALAGNRAAEIDRVLALASAHLAAGSSPLIHTALGPATDLGTALDTLPGARMAVGQALGEVARRLIERYGLARIVFAGGDTSSHALGALDVYALTCRYPLNDSPGSPLCSAHSASPALDGLELAMKGGQLGHDDYFVRLRDGEAPR